MKIGNNSELRLCSEDGRLKVNYSGDLGVWAPPTSPEHKSIDASRGHQGTRLAGTSRTRRAIEELLPGQQKLLTTLLKM